MKCLIHNLYLQILFGDFEQFICYDDNIVNSYPAKVSQRAKLSYAMLHARILLGSLD
jgi:hypothetical protein